MATQPFDGGFFAANVQFATPLKWSFIISMSFSNLHIDFDFICLFYVRIDVWSHYLCQADDISLIKIMQFFLWPMAIKKNAAQMRVLFVLENRRHFYVHFSAPDPRAHNRIRLTDFNRPNKTAFYGHHQHLANN